MKTLFLTTISVLIMGLKLYSQQPVNNVKFVNAPNLKVNYLNLALVNPNYVENGIKGELYIDKANNQLFIVKEIIKDKIKWNGTHHITYTYNEDGSVNYSKITCEGTPSDCKGEVITNDNGDIIGGKITIIH